jgi:uncharacterized protein (TIGR02217 family)
MNTFSQEELLYMNGGIIGGQYFQTLIQTNATTNREKRFATYEVPLFRGQLTNLLLKEDELKYLRSFFIRRKGMAQGFRWKNPIDYIATHFKEGVLDSDPNTWTVGGVMEESGQYAQLITPAKIYSSHGLVTKKPLFLARESIKLYESGVFSREALSDSNGQILYSGDPINLTLNIKFDTPVWFMSNELPLAIHALTEKNEGVYRLSELKIEERLLE